MGCRLKNKDCFYLTAGVKKRVENGNKNDTLPKDFVFEYFKQNRLCFKNEV